MAYNVDPRIIQAIRNQAPPELQPVLLATTMVESGGRTNAVGDNGHSYGAYQEYDKGRGAGLTAQQRMDPVGSTQRAVKEFRVYASKGLKGGQLAAAAQRPAAPGAYASKVQSHLAEAQRILAGGASNQDMQSLSTTLPSGQKAGAVDTGVADLGSNLALSLAGRSKGQSLTRAVAGAVISTAMQSVGQSATSQTTGVKANPTGSAPSAGSPGAVGAAKRWLGTPYSWGGGTPSGPGRGIQQGANTVGFDCSSLMQNAWAAQGIKIPRTTYEQIKVGKALNAKDPSSWPPGTLLFPSTHHVQMYVGNGKVIEAPQTGGHVQIVPLRSSGYIAARWPGR